MIRETIREMNMGAIGRVVLTNREKGSLDVGKIFIRHVQSIGMLGANERGRRSSLALRRDRRLAPSGRALMREALKPSRRTGSSAGILMYRRAHPKIEVLLVHPGGPYWRKKDEGAWSIPKGEILEGENVEIAARREFLEETGIAVTGPLEPLGDTRQRGGKRVTAFAVKGDLDVDALKSNTFEIEWPPKSGKLQSFPEIDRAAWFDLPAAHVKILKSQRSLLDRLVELVDRGAKRVP